MILGPLVSLSGSAAAWHAGHERRHGGGASTQEQHNILPLSQGIPRFTLLPHHTTPARTTVVRDHTFQGTRQPSVHSVSIVSYLKPSVYSAC